MLPTRDVRRPSPVAPTIPTSVEPGGAIGGEGVEEVGPGGRHAPAAAAERYRRTAGPDGQAARR